MQIQARYVLGLSKINGNKWVFCHAQSFSRQHTVGLHNSISRCDISKCVCTSCTAQDAETAYNIGPRHAASSWRRRNLRDNQERLNLSGRIFLAYIWFARNLIMRNTGENFFLAKPSRILLSIYFQHCFKRSLFSTSIFMRRLRHAKSHHHRWELLGRMSRRWLEKSLIKSYAAGRDEILWTVWINIGASVSLGRRYLPCYTTHIYEHSWTFDGGWQSNVCDRSPNVSKQGLQDAKRPSGWLNGSVASFAILRRLAYAEICMADRKYFRHWLWEVVLYIGFTRNFI